LPFESRCAPSAVPGSLTVGNTGKTARPIKADFSALFRTAVHFWQTVEIAALA
jgi:hypothetical protein